MRTARFLAIALVIGAAAAMPAAADPITDPSAVNPAEDGGFGAALYDASGLPFLLTSGPSYLHLPPHGKLRGGSGDDEDGGPLVDAFLTSLSFGSSSGSGGGSGDDGPAISGGSGDGDGGPTEGPLDLPGDDPVDLSDDTPGDGGFEGPGDDRTGSAPEPSLLLMLGPAGAYLLRRRRA